MSKPKLEAVPDPAPPETVRIPLTGKLEGHWVEVKRELTGRQTLALLRAEEDFAPVIEVIAQRTVAHSFGGDIIDQPMPTLIALMRSWTRHEQDAALDPTPASD